MPRYLNRLILVGLNLLTPGSGLIALGYNRLALLIQFGLITSVLLLCLTRAVFHPSWILVSLWIILLLYIVSIGLSIVLKNRDTSYRYVNSAIFTWVFLAVFAAGFVLKSNLLGVQLYFVPSMSMHPTLKPGQFILIDTWAYRNKEPATGDVVVFLHEVSKQVLVKRISLWPTGEPLQDEKLYLLGDNPSHSRDSRNFGGVSSKEIIGLVRMVLFGLDDEYRRQSGEYFQPVN